MKLNIEQTPPARVTLPLRLSIAPADLSKYQAATMSTRTFVDAALDFSPDDFTTDSERIAATHLSRLLSREAQLDANHRGYRGPHDVTAVPGRLTLEVAYPIDQATVHSQVVALVRESSQQQAMVDAATLAFQQWRDSLEPQILPLAKRAAAEQASWVSAFKALEQRAGEAAQALDEAALQQVVKDYQQMGEQMPSPDTVFGALAEQLAQLPGPAGLPLAWDLDAGRFWIDRDEPVFLRELTQPRVVLKASATLLYGGLFGENGPSVVLELTGGASLIKHVAEKPSAINLSALVPFFQAAQTLAESLEGDPKEYSTFGRVQSALEKIARNKTVAEMRAWIAAHGSTHLQKGIDLDYSMMRLYREERTRAILAELSADFAAWQICVDPASMNLANIPTKASPSAEALSALDLVKRVSPDAGIGFSGDIPSLVRAINDEVIYVPAETFFPNAPGLIIYREAPAPVKRSRKAAAPAIK